MEAPTPVIVYLHGNCGSRIDSFDVAEVALAKKISVFTFDFGGSGMSEGEYVSLGVRESMDIKSIVEYLRNSGEVSHIILWGRSMGSVSALRYAARYPNIDVLVNDSPFSSLHEVCIEKVQRYKFIPRAVAELMVLSMR